MDIREFSKSKDILQAEFDTRKAKNSRYSKRSYALQLGLSSGRLVEILSGKSQISFEKALEVAEKMRLSESDKRYFLLIVQNEIAVRFDGRKKHTSRKAKRLSIDEFAIISDWEYFAFMALVETKTFKNDPAWVAEKLGISEIRTKQVISYLKSQKYISEDSKGKIENRHDTLSTLTDIPSAILRKANKECILQGLEKLETIDVLMRDVTSMTLPVHPDKIPDVKNLIRKFKSEVTALMADQPTSEIYNLNIQFVPVSKLGV